MFDQSILAQSPLSIEEIQKIDSSGLSIMLRHRIRLLAHCLACFKRMNNSSSFGELPSKQDCLNWLLAQPSLSNDRELSLIHI